MSKSVYEMVADRIIAQLEEGVIPWEKPWSRCYGGAFNRVSKKSYSLLNQMLLKHNGEYATFKQWQNLGGSVRKGEKSEIVVFWKMYTVEDKGTDGTSKQKNIPLLRYIQVFHISQVDGVEPLPTALSAEIKPLEEAERILWKYLEKEHISLKQSVSDEAYYSLLGDYISLPSMEQFKDSGGYYSTVFHEVVHSTMKEGRCNRKGSRSGMDFGSESYSKEELIAEIGSADIMNLLGIETKQSFRNSVAYVQGWITRLKNEPKLVVSASGMAEKAVKFILDCGEAEFYYDKISL